MLCYKVITIGVIGMLIGLVAGQFPPPPENVTVLESHIEDGIRISYKEVNVPPALYITLPAEGTRSIFARLLQASGAIQVMSTFRLKLLRTLEYRIRHTRLTRSSGSSKHGKTPQTRRCRSG
jgi:hypothetical protein